MVVKKKREAEQEIALFKFTKEQLVKSKKYSHQRDVLNALLSDVEVYTFDEVDQKLHEFLKGKVNE
ncbi:hypothetical protein [Psychrobacillus sp. BM2]|uniref:hypothetical protein n=1 Tax=Psychrobacillus sp. BM2 TaxID=3400421 RepID=UPI003B022330